MSTYKLSKTGPEIDSALNDVGTLATSVSALQTQVGDIEEELEHLTIPQYLHTIRFDANVDGNFDVKVVTTLYAASSEPFTHSTLFEVIPTLAGCYFITPFGTAIGIANTVTATSVTGILFATDPREIQSWSYQPYNFSDTVS